MSAGLLRGRRPGMFAAVRRSPLAQNRAALVGLVVLLPILVATFAPSLVERKHRVIEQPTLSVPQEPSIPRGNVVQVIFVAFGKPQCQCFVGKLWRSKLFYFVDFEPLTFKCD